MKNKIILASFTNLIFINLFSWTWPLSCSSTQDIFTSAFGPRWIGHYDFHEGIDLQASIGTPVYAAHSGKVFASYNGGQYGGETITIIDTDDNDNYNYKTAYMHLENRLVSNGDMVIEGEQIATSGVSGTYVPHLHFEYRDGANQKKHPLQVMPYDDDSSCSLEITETSNRDWSIKITVSGTELDINSFDLYFNYFKEEINYNKTLTVDYSERINIPHLNNCPDNMEVLYGDWIMYVNPFSFTGGNQEVEFRFTSSSPDIYMNTVEGDFYTANGDWDQTLDLFTFSAGTDDVIASDSNSMLYNFPNPFNPNTTISYGLRGKIVSPHIDIYNLKGQKIKTLSLEEKEGKNSILWTGTDENDSEVGTGIYFYRLTNNGKSGKIRKMMLLK